jgi:hypothetical protein
LLIATSSSQGTLRTLPSPQILQSIALSCDGDVRNAINTLHVACLVSPSSASSSDQRTLQLDAASKRKRRPKDQPQAPSVCTFDQRLIHQNRDNTGISVCKGHIFGTFSRAGQASARQALDVARPHPVSCRQALILYLKVSKVLYRGCCMFMMAVSLTVADWLSIVDMHWRSPTPNLYLNAVQYRRNQWYCTSMRTIRSICSTTLILFVHFLAFELRNFSCLVLRI